MRQPGKQIFLPFDAESSSHTFHMGLPALSYFPFHNRTDIIRLQIPYGKRMVSIIIHFLIPFRKIRRFFGVYTVCPDKKVSSKEICFSGGVRATKHSVSGSSLSLIHICKRGNIFQKNLRCFPFTVTNSEGETSQVFLKDIASFADTQSLSTIQRDAQRRYIRLAG